MKFNVIGRTPWIAVALATTIVAAGCGSDSSDDSNASGGSKLCPDGSITIGLAKAKTGGFAVFDEAGGNGSLIAIDQLNDSGGIAGCMLKAKWSDTKSDPAIGQQVAADLIKDGAKILIAPSDFDAGIGASLAAQKAKVFAMSPEASSTDWPKAAGPTFVVQATTENDLGTGQAEFANSKGWKTTFSVVNDSFNFFKTTEEVFNSKYDGKVVDRVAVADDASDYSAVISRIRSAAPDFVYLADYYPHVGTFIKQLRDAGVDTPVLGNGTYASPDLPAAVGKERMSEVYYISQSYYEGAGTDPKVTDFNKRYEKKFGSFPSNANAIAGYEGVILLGLALEKAGTTDATAVMTAMESLTDVQLPGSKVLSFKDGATIRTSVVVGFDASGTPKQLDLNAAK